MAKTNSVVRMLEAENPSPLAAIDRLEKDGWESVKERLKRMLTAPERRFRQVRVQVLVPLKMAVHFPFMQKAMVEHHPVFFGKPSEQLGKQRGAFELARVKAIVNDIGWRHVPLAPSAFGPLIADSL